MDDTIEQLEKGGWKRMFVASEPRLSEAVETYRDLGYEVKLVPVSAEVDSMECSSCITPETGELMKIIFIRIKPE